MDYKRLLEKYMERGWLSGGSFYIDSLGDNYSTEEIEELRAMSKELIENEYVRQILEAEKLRVGKV